MSAPEMAEVGRPVPPEAGKLTRRVPDCGTETVRSPKHAALACLSARCAEHP